MILRLFACGFAAVFSFSIFAADTGHRPLADYVLNADEIQKLSGAEQKNYFQFIVQLTAVVEFAGGAKTEKQAALGLDFRQLIHFAFDSEAQAEALPKAVGVMAGKKEEIRSSGINGQEVTWDQFQKRLAELKEGESLSQVTTVTVGGLKPTAELATAKKRAVDDKKQLEGDKKPVVKAESVLITETNGYIKPSAICLFGGRASVYKTMSDDRVLCTRPKNSTCKLKNSEGEDSSGYQCENFGLLQAPNSEAIAQSLCIPLYSKKGLEDLTARCVQATQNWLKENPPTKMDPAKWNEFAEKLKKYLVAYEQAKAGNDVTMSKYCENENKINQGTQKAECNAVVSLLATLMKVTPVTQVLTAREAASASATAQPPAAASSSPAAK